MESNLKPWLEERAELLRQLEEANDTIEAIRTGMVDALVVQGDEGHQLFTLKSADQTYRYFIERMSEGAITLNRKGIILYSNSQFADMLGFGLEKVIGADILDLSSPADREELEKLIEKAWGQEVRAEIRMMGSRGRPFPFLVSCTVLQLEEGAALSVLFTNLSAQKRNEQQLKVKNEQLLEAQNSMRILNSELESLVGQRTRELFESREYFRFLADNIPVIVFTAAENGNLYCNQRWYSYTGLDFQQTQQRGWEQVLHPEDTARSAAAWEEALRTGTRFELQYRFRRHDGVYRWFLGISVPFKNDSGEVVSWIGTCTDIDDQRRQMDEKDEFIGVASHELKTPLTSLKGYIQLISSYSPEEVPALVRKYAARANESVSKLGNLVNDLLDVSKINAGKLQFHVKDFNLADLLLRCVENTEHLYPGFRVSSQIEKVIRVKGSEERMEQVAMNLINNAVKYSGHSRSLEVSGWQEGAWAVFSIQDAGIGMTDDQQAKVFERFYRVADAEFMTSGLGMGLYISMEIVKEHQGEIQVQSAPGVGSTFTVRLPLSLTD